MKPPVQIVITLKKDGQFYTFGQSVETVLYSKYGDREDTLKFVGKLMDQIKPVKSPLE